MGYRCNSRPNILIVSYWGHSRAAAEPWQWKKNLRVAFGLEKYSSGAKLAYGRDTEFKLGEDPSKIPLPKTPETMKRETNVKARSAKRTPGPNASTSSRYGYMYDAADEVELGGGNDKDDGLSYRGDTDDSVKGYIRHLSVDKAKKMLRRTLRSTPTPRWIK
ncbi:hypothetical protein PC128_g23473 [Phytophthora cactorum]|nr:hypothetical protein PC121_g21258 [Phytophthora cactorum]KAG3149030.1 hypothetical protein PC128_g23473 [Phytophthora cactorum]KAG4042106.1 hypothetical protein PC123_g22399 [Phytophthora cactorum]